ncbi:hypothetical protein QYE76_045583 [Lolium multiflorum]|uniref:Uncharacterized protein n=1 Tax=Lolium multiflorum TaxID=4521 RepID=A0AAD8WXU4_LOLMU|nr:hypothetical protein QYE76_045583 [Lolium multiflorum]
MAGARNLLDDLSTERAQAPLQAPSTVQAPPSFPQTMPTTVPYPSTQQAPQPPPIDTQEDTTACPGSINIEEEPLFAQELTQAATAQARGHRVSKRTTNYTEKEDKVLVEGWLTIGQDALTGAEQKGTAFWRRIYDYFHEHRKYGLDPFESDRSEISLQKRWGAIQTECNKFQAAYDHVKRIPVSGMGVKDLMWQALEFYKTNNGEKTFAFPHCWKELQGTPKFQEGYVATLTGNKTAKDATVIDLDGGQPCETDEVKVVYETRKTRYSQVQCAILCSLESDLQKRCEHHDPHELMKELKAIFETHAAVECYEASKHFFSCMMEEGSSVSEHMLAMTGHAKKLSDLGIVIPNRLGINRVLQSLPPSYKNFVMNYNMQNMNKELPELFGMLKAAEIEIKKEHQLLMVNKTTSFKKQGKSKGIFKKGGKKAATPL